MDWDITPGSLASLDDISSDDALHAEPTPITVYLWGFLVVLIVILALREWAGRHSSGSQRSGRERAWTYIVMAILWPLFIATVLFIILWSVLTRRCGR